MADDTRPDDDTTRIYRPYGSPPPDPGDTPDPFAPDPAPAADPFAPDPPAASRASEPPPRSEPAPSPPPPDPFAPDPTAREHTDPFRPSPLPASAPPAPAPPASAPFAADPFAAPPQAVPEPATPAPEPPSAAPPSDPFASPPAPTPDPFRAPAASDPFAPPPVPAPPPTAPPPRPTPPASDPFAPPPPETRTPNPFDLSETDPFAPPPELPDVDPVPARAPDPFTAPPVTASEDPFASLKGAALGPSTGNTFDSGLHATSHARADVTLPDVFANERTLAGAFTPVFSLILQIRASQDLGDPTALRQRVEALLGESARTARAAGVNDVDIQEAEFCLVAFLDEAILGSSWPGRDAWSAQPLQLTHYDRYDAGERFFDRLKALFDEGGSRTAVLEVYYLCLALGFKGRYAIQGREVLRHLVDDLHSRLSKTPAGRVGELAPRGRSREVPAEAEKGGIPSWVLWIGAAVLVGLLYLGLSLSLNGVATETADDLNAISTASP